MTPLTNPRRTLAEIAVISLTGILVYAATLHAPFVYDDLHAIVQSPHIKNLAEFSERVGFDNILNRSILLFTFAVNYEIGGLQTFGYHLFNLCLHIAVGMLWYHIARELLPLRSGSSRPEPFSPLPFAAGLLHALHPLATESVNYISSRSSLLATFFYLLAFYAFARHLRHAGNRICQNALLTAALLFFVLGLGAKEIVVTLPAVALVLLGFRGASPRTLGLATAILALPVIGYLIYRQTQSGNMLALGADPPTLESDRAAFLFTQFYVVVFYYLEKLFLPLGLNFEPDIEALSGITEPHSLAGLGAMMAIAYFLYRCTAPLPRFAFLWAALTVLPTSSIVPLKQLASEHHTYLPGLGITLALAYLLCQSGRTAPRAARPAVAAVFILMALLTTLRGLDYRSDVALWQDTADKSPRKTLAHNNLAVALINAKQYEQALRELERVKELDPDYASAYTNIGHIYSMRNKWEEAVREFEHAARLDSENPVTFYDAGYALIKLNRAEEALLYLDHALELRPGDAEYHFMRGNAQRALGQYDAALTSYRRALEIEPRRVSAHVNIGVIYWNLKQFTLAESEFQNARDLDPQNHEALLNLANIKMLTGQISGAIPLLQEILARKPDDASARNLLTAAEILQAQTPAGAASAAP